MQRSTSPAKKLKSSSKSYAAALSPVTHAWSRPVSHPLHFSSVEEVIRAEIHSPCEIAQIIRTNPHLGFFYMTPSASKSSYDLK